MENEKQNRMSSLDVLIIHEDKTFNDCYWTRNHNDLVREGALNHLAKLAK